MADRAQDTEGKGQRPGGDEDRPNPQRGCGNRTTSVEGSMM